MQSEVAHDCRGYLEGVKDFNFKCSMMATIDLSAFMSGSYYTCPGLCSTFLNSTCCLEVLFADECEIYHSIHSRNVVFLVQVNLHFMVELQHKPNHCL
jgi:hypothetical protein